MENHSDEESDREATDEERDEGDEEQYADEDVEVDDEGEDERHQNNQNSHYELYHNQDDDPRNGLVSSLMTQGLHHSIHSGHGMHPLPQHPLSLQGQHSLPLHNLQSMVSNQQHAMHGGGLGPAGMSGHASHLMSMSGHGHNLSHHLAHNLGISQSIDLMGQGMQAPSHQSPSPPSYVGRQFATEKDLRIWIAQEFGGLVNIHGKKFWRSGDHLAKYKSWTCSCKHEKKAGCKFKLYIAWTNKTVGPVIKTSNAVHSGHPVDIHEHRRAEYGLDGEYGPPGISEEVYAKIITSMQNRENQCKRKLAYNYCIQTFDKFLIRELDLSAPATVKRKVNDFIASQSTPEPPAPYVPDPQQYHPLL